MPEGGTPTLLSRLVAAVRALRPSEWLGQAGQVFRDTTESISDFAEQHHVRPKDVASEGVELGRRKLEGLANQEYAAAVKDFAEAEQKNIETELQRRTVETKVRKEEASAQREEAEARLASLKVVDAELELFIKLKAAGVVLHRDAAGNLTVLPSPVTVDLIELAQGRHRELTDGDTDR